MPSALIVDSDPASLKLESLLLRQEGWAVITALTVADVRSALSAFEPDVLVTGLDIGRGDDLVREMVGRRIPVVAVHSFDPESERAAFAEGCTAYVAKPIDVTTFAHLIGRARRERR